MGLGLGLGFGSRLEDSELEGSCNRFPNPGVQPLQPLNSGFVGIPADSIPGFQRFTAWIRNVVT